ncbi:TraB/GumN family protein [Arcicella aquatica]|uniref:TraB/GumN family protein n=1 Tax=Arcicella aquatica TaxID=217141 RepID=A0ABU5QGK6_9BACT|nr:TraB/GumN family protein [Arcicella aquatica]MEA5256185.1 TraB/GumN family protein [Arcicella aquatica]
MANPIKFFTISLIFSFLYFSKIYGQKEEKSLLYEISGNGLSQPSYIFGTIHVICKDDFFLPEVVKSKFASAQQVYLEIDMDDPSMMTEMQKNMMMPDGKTLKTIMSETDYTKVAKFFKDSLKTNIAFMDGMKPFILSSMSIPSMLGCPMQGYEEVFVKMAQEQKKEVKGLELVQEQFDAVDKMGMEKQADLMLVKMVDNWTEGKKELKQLIKDYKKQDIEALLADITNSPTSDAGFEKDLLETRNANWVPRMVTIMKEKATFFGVGAGHLGGAKGVLALLKKQGYTIKPVTKN